MRDALIRRTTEFQRRMAGESINAALLTAPDSIYYLAGYWGYLGVEFGRPTAIRAVNSCTAASATRSTPS